MAFSSEAAKAASQDREKQWVAVQIKGLSAWVNSYLAQSKKKNVTPIENLSDDMKNGVRLNQFLEIVAGAKLRYDLTPRMKIQAIQNLSGALQFIQEELQVRLVGIGAEDIHGGNVKLILGLLWSMFRELRIAHLAEELGEGSKAASEAQQLIAWVQKQVAPEPYNLKVDNWADFRDGKAFAGLLHLYDPSFVDYEKLGDDHKDNLRQAFEGFEKHLAIPQLLSAQEVADGTADERSLTLYTSLIYHAHATNADRRKLQQDADAKARELEEQRRKAEESKKRQAQMGSDLEKLRAENDALTDELDAAKRARDAEEAARKALEDEKARLEALLEEERRNREAAEANVDTLEALTDAVLTEKKANAYQLNLLNALNGDDYESVGRLVGVDADAIHSGDFSDNVDADDAGADSNIEETKVEVWEKEAIRQDPDTIKKNADDRKKKLRKQINDLKSKVRKEVKRRAAVAKQIADMEAKLRNFEEESIRQGKAFSALSVLKKNLQEHLEDLGEWRDLYDLDLDPSKLSVYDEEKINANLENKRFEDQVTFLSGKLQEENRNLTRILRVKDSKRDIEDSVAKSGTLFMKTEKKGDWTEHYFQLLSGDLAYFADSSAEDRQGSVSLKEAGTTITLLKPEAAGEAKVFPIKLKLASGQQFYIATTTKKDRKDWAAVLNGKLVHFEYLNDVEEESIRPDSRVLNLCAAGADCPSVYLDNGELGSTSVKAIARILPFLESVNVVSFANTAMTDDEIELLAPGLAKASIHLLDLSNNHITSSGAKKIAEALAGNKTIEEVNVSNNQIDDEGATALSSLFSGKRPIKRIVIEGNKVSDAGTAEMCKGLAGAAGTSTLQFGKNDIGDAGAAAIADLLRANSNISEVSLTHNSISDDGVQTLCSALVENTSVHKLDLSANDLGPASVARIHELLASNKTLRSVDLSGNEAIVEGSSLGGIFSNGALVVSGLVITRNKA